MVGEQCLHCNIPIYSSKETKCMTCYLDTRQRYQDFKCPEEYDMGIFKISKT